jgi:D-alanyl-D-alanine endopeptidase (penicillin-binding protein 7)
MKPTRILVALAAFAGFASLFYYVSSDANVVQPPVVKEAETYIKAEDIVQYGQPNRLFLRSGVALVMDDREGVMLYGRNVDHPRPIASLTKLMTALVILDSGLSLDDTIEVTRADRDRLRGTRSRLPFGGVFSRYDLLRAALGASDNRAAAALGRTYPGGTEAIVEAMNAKAKELGMTQTRYADASGLDNHNISTARDLARLVAEIQKHPMFHVLTTTPSFRITNRASGRELAYHNTNRLVRRDSWHINLSKTGYTAKAGNCLIMQANIANRPLTIVLLNSWGKYSRYGDAQRINQWLHKAERRVPRILTARANPD